MPAAGTGEALAPVQHAAVVDDEEVARVELESELKLRPLQDQGEAAIGGIEAGHGVAGRFDAGSERLLKRTSVSSPSAARPIIGARASSRVAAFA